MPYTIADYLLDRLAQAGVDRIFGVPGDFTLQFLDHVEAHPDIEWCGTANELGAGYAADGYARVRGLGVVCTTFGVGELSAINAVAGAYAEHVPVLSLVGSPTTAVQSARRPTHHSLGDGDFGHTLRLTREVTVAAEMLAAETATEQIDRVLGAMLADSLPGYLSVPADVAEIPTTPPEEPLFVPEPSSDPVALAAFEEAARDFLAGSAAPVVLADVLVHRAHAEDELHALLSAGGLRFASLLWGRRVIDEGSADYIGTYIGAASEPAVLAEIEGAERLLTVGVTFTDLISGFFSQHLRDDHRIDVLPRAAVVGDRHFPGVMMRDALDALTRVLARRPAEARPEAGPLPVTAVPSSTAPLTQRELWDVVAAHLRPGDLVLADQGTSFYGMGAHRLPHDALFIGQPLWASIGYTLPAILGAAHADPARRPVLLIGDGAAQLTIAELSTLIRDAIPAIVLVVNNDGYTVERAIHGPDKAYNDIAAWRWTELPAAFGASPDRVQSVTARTVDELAAAFAAADARPDVLTFVEAVVPALDVPPLLESLARAAARANATAARH